MCREAAATREKRGKQKVKKKNRGSESNPACDLFHSVINQRCVIYEAFLSLAKVSLSCISRRNLSHIFTTLSSISGLNVARCSAKKHTSENLEIELRRLMKKIVEQAFAVNVQQCRSEKLRMASAVFREFIDFHFRFFFLIA
jgi:hypothetical protein